MLGPISATIVSVLLPKLLLDAESHGSALEQDYDNELYRSLSSNMLREERQAKSTLPLVIRAGPAK